MLIFLLGTKHNLCLIGWERCVMLILLFVGIFDQLWLYAGEVTIVMMHWWWWWWLSLTMQWVFWEQCSITQHVQTCLSSLIDRTNDYWSMCSGSYWSRWWGWFWYWFSEGIWTWKHTAYICAISLEVGLWGMTDGHKKANLNRKMKRMIWMSVFDAKVHELFCSPHLF